MSALLHQPCRAAHRRARAAADLGAQSRKGRVGRDQGGGGEDVEDFAIKAGGDTGGSGGRSDGLGSAEDGRRGTGRRKGGAEGGEDGEGTGLKFIAHGLVWRTCVR